MVHPTLFEHKRFILLSCTGCELNTQNPGPRDSVPCGGMSPSVWEDGPGISVQY